MALCTREEVKSYMSMTGSNSDIDSTIKDLCNRLSATIESYCGREFSSAEYTEYHNGYGNVILYTNNYPVTSVSGIWEDTSRDWPVNTEVDSDEYFVNEGAIYRRDAYFLDWPMSIKIIYTAGYATIPYDLKQACIVEVARSYEQRKEQGVDTKAYADANTTYVLDDFLPNSKLVIDLYKHRKII